MSVKSNYLKCPKWYLIQLGVYSIYEQFNDIHKIWEFKKHDIQFANSNLLKVICFIHLTQLFPACSSYVLRLSPVSELELESAGFWFNRKIRFFAAGFIQLPVFTLMFRLTDYFFKSMKVEFVELASIIILSNNFFLHDYNRHRILIWQH